MRLKSQKWRYSQSPTAFLSAVRSERLSSEQPTARNISGGTDSEFICAKDAAQWLGIPLRSFYQYVQQGLLPSYKLGRHRLFRRLEILHALCANDKATRNEILR